MKSKILYKGYDENFILNHSIPTPCLNEEQLSDLAVNSDGTAMIRYINFSLQLSCAHKFPYYTATNIDGLKFKKVPRKDNWRKDDRLPKDLQFGSELYSAAKSNFDRGHMTKREDVQWGDTVGIALNAADSTFFYTNSVPQHKDLNRDIWRSLEDYILHAEAKKSQLRICVFTGPVLSKSNPYFTTPINNKQIQIPAIFWKIVVYEKEDGKIYRVGFMMSQNKLLAKGNMIEELESEDDIFMRFKDAETYQVNVSLIEEMTGIQMPPAIDSYTDDRDIKLVMDEIEIDPDLESSSIEFELGFAIRNILL